MRRIQVSGPNRHGLPLYEVGLGRNRSLPNCFQFSSSGAVNDCPESCTTPVTLHHRDTGVLSAYRYVYYEANCVPGAAPTTVPAGRICAKRPSTGTIGSLSIARYSSSDLPEPACAAKDQRLKVRETSHRPPPMRGLASALRLGAAHFCPDAIDTGAGGDI